MTSVHSGVRIDRLLNQDRISWIHECLDSLRYSTDGSKDGKIEGYKQ
jgi:hypothetical protein